MRIRVERHVQFSNCAIKKNALSGTVRVPRGFSSYFEENDELTVERIEE